MSCRTLVLEGGARAISVPDIARQVRGKMHALCQHRTMHSGCSARCRRALRLVSHEHLAFLHERAEGLGDALWKRSVHARRKFVVVRLDHSCCFGALELRSRRKKSGKGKQHAARNLGAIDICQHLCPCCGLEELSHTPLYLRGEMLCLGQLQMVWQLAEKAAEHMGSERMQCKLAHTWKQTLHEDLKLLWRCG
eukprot:2580235-Rhodomonas_salina.3